MRYLEWAKLGRMCKEQFYQLTDCVWAGAVLVLGGLAGRVQLWGRSRAGAFSCPVWRKTHLDLQLDFEHQDQSNGCCHLSKLV